MSEVKDPIWRHARIGRRMYETPEELWEDAQRYFEWADENPIKGQTATTKSKKNKRGNKEEEKVEASLSNTTRPYTLPALCTFCGIKRWGDFKAKYMPIAGFEDVISAIENIITSQQLDNAMVGIFKENLTARLNGIADTQIAEGYFAIDAGNGNGKQFNGFSFIPFTDGLVNSEEARIASGEVQLIEEASNEEESKEPLYAEIIDENGNGRE